MFIEGEVVILNEKTHNGLPMRIGETAMIIENLCNSPNYDYLIEFQDGETAKVKESEINKLTVKDKEYMDFLYKGSKVLYTPTNEEVLLSKLDYIHGQAEVDFQDGSSTAVGFEMLQKIDIDDLKNNDENINFDIVNKPFHYASTKYETIDIIEDKVTPEMFEGFCVGNAIKYITRYRDKNGVQDIKKAVWYLNKLLELYKEK